MLIPLKEARQSPMRVELTALVLGLTIVMFVEAQRAIGFPDSQVLGATLSLRIERGIQHKQGFDIVFV
jgi:hypothetical protein